jgi:hypothetical protein
MGAESQRHYRRETQRKRGGSQVVKRPRLEGEEAGTGTDKRQREKAREETVAWHKAPPVSKERDS